MWFGSAAVNGMVGKSSNGGKNWKWMTVKGFEKKQFRDIEAFDANTAIIMTVAEPAYILKTMDGGETWKVVYENKTKGMFLDAMDFVNGRQGMVVGDPVGNKIFLAETNDGGRPGKNGTKSNLLLIPGRHFLPPAAPISGYIMISVSFW
jgi:photosystem II stability/assembly factor-like uncharacterized protein